MQGIAIIEPILAKAARKLGVDQVALRRVNCPEGKAEFGPPNHGKRGARDELLLQAGAGPGRGAVQVAGARSASRSESGSKVRGVGVSLSCFVGGTIGFDGLLVITPEGRVRFHSGIGNLGTESVIDVHRAGAEVLGVPWEICDVVWGDTSKHLAVHMRLGRQPDHPRHDPGRVRGGRRSASRGCKEIAAKTQGGKPEDYEVANQRVFRKGGGAGMSFAQAAQKRHQLGGIYDGHEAPTT